MKITTTQYVHARDRYNDRRIKKELLFIITLGFGIAVLATYGGFALIMIMVEKGWMY